MIVLKTKVLAKGLSGEDICHFMLNCTDEQYQVWWPGTHFQFHTMKRFPGDIGNLVTMDELVGPYRVKMKGIVTDVVPGKKVVWRMIKFMKLPAWLSLEFENNSSGVNVTHTLKVGLNGLGKLLDPLLKLNFSRKFEAALDEHARIEFPKLREIILQR